MSENQNENNHSAFINVGRSLGRSRKGQFVVAIAVAALFSYLAYVAWHAPDLAATVLTIGLLVYGFQLTWRILPIPGATRARWVREQQLAEQCPAGRYRGFLWVGIGTAVGSFWRSDSVKPLDYFTFVVPSIFIAIGIISHILCKRFIQNERSA